MRPEKIGEATNGAHVYMLLRTESGRIEEIDAYIRENGWSYRTTADNDPEIRNEIIRAFCELY